MSLFIKEEMLLHLEILEINSIFHFMEVWEFLFLYQEEKAILKKWSQTNQQLINKNKPIKKEELRSLTRPQPTRIEKPKDEETPEKSNEEEVKEGEGSIEISEHDSFEEDTLNYKEVAVLNVGASFGELALISNKPRAATIRAKEDSHFAVLEKYDYQKVLGVIQEKILNRKINFFKNLQIFADWTRGAIAKATYYFHEKSFSRNYFLYKEGDPWNFTYVVIDGEFEATKITPMINDEEIEDWIMKECIKQDQITNRLNKAKLKEIQNCRIKRKQEQIWDSFDQSRYPRTSNSQSFWNTMNHKQK